jgi:hypothetical protein
VQCARARAETDAATEEKEAPLKAAVDVLCGIVNVSEEGHGENAQTAATGGMRNEILCVYVGVQVCLRDSSVM